MKSSKYYRHMVYCLSICLVVSRPGFNFIVESDQKTHSLLAFNIKGRTSWQIVYLGKALYGLPLTFEWLDSYQHMV